MHNKKIFMVVGMHRSGTSIVANCLQSFGLELSDNLVKPSVDNPDGFFEDAEVVKFNTAIESVLSRSHMDPISVLPFDADWFKRKDVIKIAKRLENYISKQLNQKKSFLIKDPRTARLLPLYQNIFDSLEVEPVYIFVFRHPASVIRSKSKRDSLDKNIVEAQWQISNMSALRSISQFGNRTFFVNYQSLLLNSKVELALLKKSLREFLPAKNKKALPKIHTDAQSDKLSEDIEDVTVNKFSLRLISFLESATSSDFVSAKSVKKFEALDREYEKTLEISQPWLSLISLASAEISAGQLRKREITRLKDELKYSNGKVFGLSEGKKALTTRLEDMQASNQELSKGIADLRKSSEDLRGANQTADRAYQTLEKLLKGRNNKIEGLESSIQQYEIQNTELTNELDLINADHQNLNNDYISLEERLTKLSTTYESMSSAHQLLLLKQKRKVFLIANKMDKLKDRLGVSRLLRGLYRVKFIYRKPYTALVLVRRSLIANGFNKTLAKIYSSGKSKIRRLVSNEASQINRKIAHSEIAKSPDNIALIKKAFNLDDERALLVQDIFLSEYYLENAARISEVEVTTEAALKHFVDFGVQQGLSPSPLFNAHYYLDTYAIEGVDQKDAFSHWVTFGIDQKQIPTPLFDESYFLKRHSLVLKDEEWAFRRFFTISVFNNANPNQFFDTNWYQQTHDLGSTPLPAFYHYLMVGYKLGWRPSPMFPAYSRDHCANSKLSPLEEVIVTIKFSTLRARLENSSVLIEQLNKASALEPKILSPDGYRRLNVLPFTNPLFPSVQNIRNALKYDRYDSVVLIPHCRYGGSGLVSGELCRSLKRCFPNERVLLVRTDNDAFMRPDWFPSSIDIINLLDYGCDVPDVHRKKILLDMLIGLKPKRIINVHSRLAWEVLVEYGDRLSRWSSLYGYTFCYDLNMFGAKVGYPVKYVPHSIVHLKKLFVDNSFLKKDLVEVNKWGKELDQKISILWSPSGSNHDVYAPKIDERRVAGEKKNIFWAGRFDRQKKFDVVIKLAQRNPDWCFKVWGAAMLDEGAPEEKLPENIQLQGLFDSYSEIPFEECDVWLYTSGWDGLPTLLIELGLIGVPLVASAVWGTIDLITSETAWPVANISSASAYEKSINDVLANRDEAIKRSKNLKKLVLKRHSKQAYDSSIATELSADIWSEDHA